MKKPIISLLPVFFIFILIPCLAGAQVSVSLRLDRKEASPMDSIKMVVSVSGTKSSDSRPTVQGLQHFNITKGGTSSRVKVINGQVDAAVDYVYFIQPKKKGTFEIGPAEIAVQGKHLRSDTVQLTVLESTGSTGLDRGPLFLKAELSSPTAYVDQQVIFTLKLFRRAKVSDISLNLPETEHLVFKKLGKPLQYKKSYNEGTYQVLELSYALMASKPGVYGIKSAKMQMTVYQPKRRPFRGLFGDQFFSFSSGRPKTLTSEPLELKVVPLPGAGRPAGFSGLVGSFKIDSRLEPSKIEVGESATLTVILSGRGNVNRIPDLKGPELSHANVYADQPVLKVEPDSQGLSGSKTMKWAIVPEKEGPYQISPLLISFFDIETHHYRTIKTLPHRLSVLPGEEEQIQVSVDGGSEKRGGGTGKQAVKEIGRDILPVHTSIKDVTPFFHVRIRGVALWGLLLAPFFVYAVVSCAVRFRKKSFQAEALTRAKKAARTFIKKFNQEEPNASDLTLSVRRYLNDRFGLTLGSLTPEEAAQILTSKGVRRNTAQKLQGILQSLEDLIYIGRGQECPDAVRQLPRLIKRIEKEIR